MMGPNGKLKESFIDRKLLMMEEPCEVFDDSISSEASSSSSNLITEEDLIDTLFCACDPKNVGVVAVSKLIETLKFTTGEINDVSRYV